MSDIESIADDKTIIRTPHSRERPYFSMSRATAQDESLSWSARGVLAYLLSKPTNWRVQIGDLQQKCGRDKVHTILDELAKARYLEIIQKRRPDGVFSHNEYRVYETPFTENPLTVNPSTDKPFTVNPPRHNRESTKDRKEKKKEGELPPHLKNFQNGNSPNKLAYLDTWRDAHDGVKPAALKGNERMNALDDVDDLTAMECSLDDLTAYVKQRQKDGKSTVWRFMIQDIHVYLNNKNKPATAPADSIDFDNPPLDNNGNPMIYVQEGWITRDEWLTYDT